MLLLLLLICCAFAYEWSSTLHDENGHVSTTFPPGGTTSWEVSATHLVTVDIFVDGDLSKRLSEQLVASGSLLCPKHCVMSISATVPGETVITVQIKDAQEIKVLKGLYQTLSDIKGYAIMIFTLACIMLVSMACLMAGCLINTFRDKQVNTKTRTNEVLLSHDTILEDSSAPMETS